MRKRLNQLYTCLILVFICFFPANALAMGSHCPSPAGKELNAGQQYWRPDCLSHKAKFQFNLKCIKAGTFTVNGKPQGGPVCYFNIFYSDSGFGIKIKLNETYTTSSTGKFQYLIQGVGTIKIFEVKGF